MDLPSSNSIPRDLDGMTSSQVEELAGAYIELLQLMTEALEACETGYGFFSWSGRGFHITGHPPEELTVAIAELMKEQS